MANAPSAPIDLVAQAWGRRLTTLAHAGVPVKKLQRVVPVIQQDIRSVRTGGQGMANDEAMLGMLSAMKRKPVLEQPKKSGWSPTDFVGDVAHDIKDLTTQAVPGLARFVANIIPNTIETAHYVSADASNPKDRKWMKSKGYELNPDLGGAIRNIAHTPLAGAVPGVHTVAGTTSPEGRMELLHHPVMTALDVYPYAHFGARGLAATGVLGDTAIEGSAAEAAKAGKPVKSLYRGLVPESARAEIGARTTEALQKAGLDPQSFGLSRSQAIANRVARKEQARMWEETGLSEKLKNLSPDEHTLLAHEAQFPDEHPNISPEHRDILNTVDEWHHQQVVNNPDLHYVTVAGKPRVYHTNSPVFKAYKGMLDAEEAYNAARTNVQEANRSAFEHGGTEPSRTTYNSRTGRTENLEARVADTRKTYDAARTHFDEMARTHEPANYSPMMARDAAKAMANAGESHIDDALGELDQHWQHSNATGEEWKSIRDDARAGWQEAAQRAAELGVREPTWLHSVEPGQAGRTPSPLPDVTTPRKSRAMMDKVMDLRPSAQNLGVSISHELAADLRGRASQLFYETHVRPLEKTFDQLRPELENEVARLERRGRMPQGLDEAGKIDYVLGKKYVQGGPQNMLFGRGKAALTADMLTNPEATFLPRNVSDILDDLNKPLSQNSVMKGSRKATQVYKTSVMAFSLKHMAHILFGGMVFLAGRGGVDELLNLRKAYKMVREGEMPNELSQHLDINTPDENFQVYAGNKLGKLYMSGPGKIADKIAKFDEFVSNVQRADGYLSGKARGLRKGMTEAEATQAGLEHSYKALVDIDGLNPLERSVVRQVFPFYAFMRHTLKYILTYPIDHPLRAAILSRISDIESKDSASGLPQQLQSLFMLGSPDAQGNQSGIEMKQFNPFRDTGSYFTLAGFMQSLNPALAAPFAAMGIDKFTGSAGLYPDLEIDPKTGNLVAKRPPNAPWNALTTFIPEADLLDHFMGLTQDMRDLKARNPEAYRNRMWASFFLPFQKKRVNRGEEAAGMQSNILAVLQQKVAKATRTGDTSGLDDYPLVPYQGQLIPPKLLEAYIKVAKQVRPGVAPKSALPQVKLIR